MVSLFGWSYNLVIGSKCRKYDIQSLKKTKTFIFIFIILAMVISYFIIRLSFISMVLSL
jgi:hypothetical protein